MQHILYISYDGMTDSLGQSQVLPYLKGLSKLGYTISLISCEKKNRYAEFKDQIVAICEEANIKWFPQQYTKKPPLLSTIWDIHCINKQADKINKNHKIDLIHCRSYIAAISALRLKKNKGIKVLFDMRGFWADERIDGGIWRLSNPIFKLAYQFFKKKEKEFFTTFDHVISLTENGKNEILSWNLSNINAEKITIIPCCVNLELFDPAKISESKRLEQKQKLGFVENDFVLGYVGSIGTWYMLSEMLDYFKVLTTKHEKSKFLFVTNEKSESIFDMAQQKGIHSNQIVVTSCLHKEVPLYISLFNQSIFFIRPTYSKKASSPTKQGEIMAMGIPLVCNAGIGDTDAIVHSYKSGTVINKLNNEEYMKNIESESAFDKDLTIQGARDFFSLEEGVNRYSKVYYNLLSKK